MKLLLEKWQQYLEEDVGGFTAEYQLFIPRACSGEKCEPAKLLYEEFPLEGDKTGHIDFEAALQKYDGIHWGKKGGGDSESWDFGSSGMWDMESTVWRDASVLEVIEVVSVSQAEERESVWAEGKKRK
jgi:hypothetical protein